MPTTLENRQLRTPEIALPEDLRDLRRSLTAKLIQQNARSVFGSKVEQEATAVFTTNSTNKTGVRALETTEAPILNTVIDFFGWRRNNPTMQYLSTQLYIAAVDKKLKDSQSMGAYYSSTAELDEDRKIVRIIRGPELVDPAAKLASLKEKMEEKVQKHPFSGQERTNAALLMELFTMDTARRGSMLRNLKSGYSGPERERMLYKKLGKNQGVEEAGSRSLPRRPRTRVPVG